MEEWPSYGHVSKPEKLYISIWGPIPSNHMEVRHSDWLYNHKWSSLLGSSILEKISHILCKEIPPEPETHRRSDSAESQKPNLLLNRRKWISVFCVYNYVCVSVCVCLCVWHGNPHILLLLSAHFVLADCSYLIIFTHLPLFWISLLLFFEQTCGRSCLPTFQY